MAYGNELFSNLSFVYCCFVMQNVDLVIKLLVLQDNLYNVNKDCIADPMSKCAGEHKNVECP